MGQNGREVTDDDCDYYDGFTRLYGDMYRMLSLSFLEGPNIWSSNLSDIRK